MTFTVVWKPGAVEALAAAWLSSDRRVDVAAAADEIERLLRTGPTDVGVPGPLDSRILVCVPLAVVFDIRPDDRIVEVLRVVTVPSGA